MREREEASMSDEIEHLRRVHEAATGGRWTHDSAEDAWLDGQLTVGAERVPPDEILGRVVVAYAAPREDADGPNVQDARAIALAHNVGAELFAVVEAADAMGRGESARPRTIHGKRLRHTLDALRAKVRAEREGANNG